jgi:antitoxin component YwqK of YwqJK toxin-antitoxin module
MIKINDKDVDKLLEFVDVDNAGGCVFNYQGKPFNGIIQAFYDNGNLYDEAEYTDGHIGGVQREYYENGQMKDEVILRFAKPEGDWRGWDEQGNLLYHSIWKEGEMIKEIIPRKA